jgi:protein-L-isoaspartate(D-aspartate) O-methyltransferase
MSLSPGGRRPAGGAGVTSPASRARLVADLQKMGISQPRVLEALAKIPRHEFVEDAWRNEAYQNKPLPIGFSQTISQPYIVALMTEVLLQVQPMKRVLEIGTGSGYQTAALAECMETVFSVERVKALSESARARLRGLGYRNIHYAYADGSLGWEAHAPYDGIIVTAAAEQVPQGFREQLAPGGRLVAPVGPREGQMLRVIDRTPRGFVEQDVAAVSFVPLLPGRI